MDQMITAFDMAGFVEKARGLTLEVAENLVETSTRGKLEVHQVFLTLLWYAIDLLRLVETAGSDKNKVGGKKCLN